MCRHRGPGVSLLFPHCALYRETTKSQRPVDSSGPARPRYEAAWLLVDSLFRVSILAFTSAIISGRGRRWPRHQSILLKGEQKWSVSQT
jgi:hypothetical protein